MTKTRGKIIYVDDVNYSLISVKNRLKEHYEVYPAQSVDILFEILERIIPDLILLDVNMPNVDGYEVIKMLKSNPGYAGIKVVFLSAQGDRESLIKGISLGAVDYITKPATDADLIDCIELHTNPIKRDVDKPIILAVDDNPSILKSINYLLKDNYIVRTLPEPERIKEVMRVITPDLILLDCMMPGLNGFDLVPIIRKFPIHEETPIIFLTSDGTIDNITVAMHLGACDYIIKPIDDLILLEKLSQHLSNYLVNRRLRSL
ncbi:MAG: response regulator [Oscillospiraceae bacterium]|jgi:DNA-binding response OmpR family regulator|nr:response regulator [Oscillospiraceae bacterium]